MIEVHYTKAFDKSFLKLPHKKQQKVRQAIALFIDDPHTPALRLHELKGEFAGVWSMSAGGDLRLHFRYHGQTIVFFMAVGSHAQLY